MDRTPLNQAVENSQPAERATERPTEDARMRLIHTPSYGFMVLWVFALLIAGCVTAGYFYCRSLANQYRTEVEQRFTAIAELKVGELARWRKERLGLSLIHI